jgi:hypothetical protein
MRPTPRRVSVGEVFGVACSCRTVEHGRHGHRDHCERTLVAIDDASGGTGGMDSSGGASSSHSGGAAASIGCVNTGFGGAGGDSLRSTSARCY